VLNQNLRAVDNQLITFNPELPPTGANLLRATRRQSTTFGSATVAGWERIDNTSTTTPMANDLPGLLRMSPVTGKPGHYATNLGQTSGKNTLRFSIDVGGNALIQGVSANATNGRNTYIGPHILDSTSTTIMTLRVRLTFFEVIPTTSLVVPLGYKVVSVGLNRGCLTAAYYAQSRANLDSTLRAGFVNPMPA
jgi:hypothetical protein